MNVGMSKRTRTRLSSIAGAMLLAGLISMAGPARASLPTGYKARYGAEAVAITTDGNVMTIKQTSPVVKLDWDSFDIGTGHTVDIFQPDATSLLVNRVVGGAGSQIDGSLIADGRVYLINPHGVQLGKSAMVEAAGLMVAGMWVDEGQMVGAGPITDLRISDRGEVVNRGAIAVSHGGIATLASGRALAQEGWMEARRGSINLVLSPTLVLGAIGDIAGTTNQPASAERGMRHGGQTLASGGQIDIRDGVGPINLGGMLQAADGGRVSIYARHGLSEGSHIEPEVDHLQLTIPGLRVDQVSKGRSIAAAQVLGWLEEGTDVVLGAEAYGSLTVDAPLHSDKHENGRLRLVGPSVDIRKDIRLTGDIRIEANGLGGRIVMQPETAVTSRTGLVSFKAPPPASFAGPAPLVLGTVEAERLSVESPVSVTFQAGSKVYDGTLDVPRVSNEELRGIDLTGGNLRFAPSFVLDSPNVGDRTVSAHVDIVGFHGDRKTSLKVVEADDSLGRKVRIEPRPLGVDMRPVRKVFDGNNEAKVELFPADALAGSDLSVSYRSATFDSAEPGSQRIRVSGLALSGRDAKNYRLKETSITGPGVIDPKPIEPVTPTVEPIGPTVPEKPVDPLKPASPVLPSGHVVRHGDVRVDAVGTVMTIRQTSPAAKLDWDHFDIGKDHAVRIEQPDATAFIVNRVTGMGGSHLDGALTADGRVYVINPHGISVGKTANVDAGGFLASTVGLADDMMNGASAPRGLTGGDGGLEQRGTISVRRGGVLTLLASGSLSQSGRIEAPSGTVHLISAQAATLDDTGKVASIEGALGGLDHAGTTSAHDGEVLIAANDSLVLDGAVSAAGKGRVTLRSDSPEVDLRGELTPGHQLSFVDSIYQIFDIDGPGTLASSRIERWLNDGVDVEIGRTARNEFIYLESSITAEKNSRGRLTLDALVSIAAPLDVGAGDLVIKGSGMSQSDAAPIHSRGGSVTIESIGAIKLGDVQARTLSITRPLQVDFRASSKPYDGTTAAQVDRVVFSGIDLAENGNLRFLPTYRFDSPEIGLRQVGARVDLVGFNGEARSPLSVLHGEAGSRTARIEAVAEPTRPPPPWEPTRPPTPPLPEPAEPEPAKPEPAKPEPVTPEPVTPEPAKPAPIIPTPRPNPPQAPLPARQAIACAGARDAQDCDRSLAPTPAAAASAPRVRGIRLPPEAIRP